MDVKAKDKVLVKFLHEEREGSAKLMGEISRNQTKMMSKKITKFGQMSICNNSYTGRTSGYGGTNPNTVFAGAWNPNQGATVNASSGGYTAIRFRGITNLHGDDGSE